MMYGMTPFGRNAFNLFNMWNDLDKDLLGDTMPVNACRTDIKDAGDKYIMESELPGFEKEDINIDLNGEYLVKLNSGKFLVMSADLYKGFLKGGNET